MLEEDSEAGHGVAIVVFVVRGHQLGEVHFVRDELVFGVYDSG